MQRIAVVMAGGSGERFWPLSRALRPKQLLKLTDPSLSMLEEAVRRIEPLVGKDGVFLSTSETLREPLTQSGLVPPGRLLCEPDKRNTLGALVWVSAQLMALMPEKWMDLSVAVLTADHKIGEAEAFRATVNAAMTVAESTGGLVTIGVKPTRAETGFGYIEVNRDDPSYLPAHRVARFREKPTFETATEMVAAGKFLWNSGMFFWKLRSFMDELERALPTAAEITTRIAHALIAQDVPGAMKAFQELPNLSIDYALMEHSDNVFVVEAGFSWDDVGAWNSLERTRTADEHGNVIVGTVVELDSSNSVILNDSNTMTTCVLGMEDVIVVTTDDAVLVCPKSRAQDVKRIVEELRARGSQAL